MRRSTFYSDVTSALELQLNNLNHQTPSSASQQNTEMAVEETEEHSSDGCAVAVGQATVELSIEEITHLPKDCYPNLVLCKVTFGRHGLNTSMQQPEHDDVTTVRFTQPLVFNTSIKREMVGYYSPQAQYIVVDVYVRYNDKNKGDEFLGRLMIPLLSLSQSRQVLQGIGGSTPHHSVKHNVSVKCRGCLVALPDDYVGWLGTPCPKFEEMQYKIVLGGQISALPGSFEKVEVYVREVSAEMCDETFPADVYLTNFRIIVVALKEEHKHLSSWSTFPNTFPISKAYIQISRSIQCCYTVKFYDCRTVKIVVPAMSIRQKIKSQIEQKFSKPRGSQGEDKLYLEMATQTPKSPPRTADPRHSPHLTLASHLSERVASDGEANEGFSDEDVLGENLLAEKSRDNYSLYNLDQMTLDDSEDDLLDPPLMVPSVKIEDLSDGDSVDSLDTELETPSLRTRIFTGTSVSSFTSHLSGYYNSGSSSLERLTKKKSLSADEPSATTIRNYRSNFKKLQMDSIRLRLRFLGDNTAHNQPCQILLKEVAPESRAGFTRYDLDKEHNRQGDMRGWGKVDNTDFKLCKSYPPLFYVPVRGSAPKIINTVFQFRSKGRLPALSWLSDSGSVLLRSSQPRTGILYKNCKEDQEYLKSALHLSRERGDNEMQFVIFDARSKIAASGNQMKGKGTENVAHYEQTKLTYLDMANIHAIRDSHEKLTTVCSTVCNVKWWSRVEHSQWFVHVQGLLRGAYFVSQHLNAGGGCLVHCSDGWDRTSQLTSLSLILVDSYYRTYSGFQVLIEREWLSFGHRFHDRVGLSHPSSRCPIFLLFLDALHQIITQFPNKFEFKLELLVVLCDLYSSGWTTTFLRNCPAERDRTNRVQVWDVLDGMREGLTNEQYVLSTAPLSPGVSLRHVVLWRDYFLRFDHFKEHCVEDRTGPVVWVPDSEVDKCQQCQLKFNAIKRRKHHCRSCGKIFCGGCASQKICIPLKNFTAPVLVCDKCYEENTADP